MLGFHSFNRHTGKLGVSDPGVLQFPLFDSASQPNTESSFLKKNERDTESALTIATYNVNSFNHEHTGFSCKQIVACMKELGVDIFCFQEFGINHEFGIDSLRTVLSEWPYYFGVTLLLPGRVFATGCVQPLSHQGEAARHLPKFQQLQPVV